MRDQHGAQNQGSLNEGGREGGKKKRATGDLNNYGDNQDTG